MDLKTIYQGAENLINQLIRKESTAQGHYLTGALEDSLQGKIVKNELQGFAVYYTQYVNDGTRPEKASFRQFPFVVEYFNKRGYPEYSSNPATLTSRKLAAMTIHKWMKEGMSTQASKRFSKTGARQNMIEAAFVGGNTQIDEYFGNSFDFAVNEKYLQEKSETI